MTIYIQNGSAEKKERGRGANNEIDCADEELTAPSKRERQIQEKRSKSSESCRKNARENQLLAWPLERD